jgi:hypothetical protein
MAAGDDFGGLTQELGSHYLSGVASQSVLYKQKNENMLIRI